MVPASGSAVEFHGDSVEGGLGVRGRVGAPGQLLAERSRIRVVRSSPARVPAAATTHRRAWPARLFRSGADSELGWCVAVLLWLAYTLGLAIVHNTAGHHWRSLACNVLFTLPVVVLRYAALVWAEQRRRRLPAIR